MRIEIKRLQQQLGFTVLFVTHDQIEAMSLSTRLALMNQGRIEQIGAPQDVYEHPQTPFVEDFWGAFCASEEKSSKSGLASTSSNLTA